MKANGEIQQLVKELKELRKEVKALKKKIENSRDQVATEHPYIYCSDRMHLGEPTIRGTAITVRTIVERLRLGDSVEQIVAAYPFLTPAQVHDALAYYYDHSAEIERYIHENQEALWRVLPPAAK